MEIEPNQNFPDRQKFGVINMIALTGSENSISNCYTVSRLTMLTNYVEGVGGILFRVIITHTKWAHR